MTKLECRMTKEWQTKHEDGEGASSASPNAWRLIDDQTPHLRQAAFIKISAYAKAPVVTRRRAMGATAGEASTSPRRVRPAANNHQANFNNQSPNTNLMTKLGISMTKEWRTKQRSAEGGRRGPTRNTETLRPPPASRRRRLVLRPLRFLLCIRSLPSSLTATSRRDRTCRSPQSLHSTFYFLISKYFLPSYFPPLPTAFRQ